jgi:hypothetical protein
MFGIHIDGDASRTVLCGILKEKKAILESPASGMRAHVECYGGAAGKEGRYEPKSGAEAHEQRKRAAIPRHDENGTVAGVANRLVERLKWQDCIWIKSESKARTLAVYGTTPR